MNQSRYTLPQPVGKLVALLPLFPGSMLFVTALNLVLRRRLPSDVQQSLLGKKIQIRVTDAQLVFDFQWDRRGFVACKNAQLADLAIAASAHDFLLLAQRHEDPDTLFFSRRLSMEGDTELGLLVKNTLDAMEWPAMDLSSLAPNRVLSRLKPQHRGQ